MEHGIDGKMTKINERFCGNCCWFFMAGDDPKDGTCGIPPKDGVMRGRNYCYETDEICDDYEEE